MSLVGFGSFGTSVRSARTARNPRTGEPIQVPETTVATFAPSKVLKDKVNDDSPSLSRQMDVLLIFQSGPQYMCVRIMCLCVSE